MPERVYLRKQSRRRLELTALVSGLFLLLGVAVAFVIFIVQVQGAGTAYLAGQSRWSRAQIGTVFALYRLADQGNAADLASAYSLLDIPLGDMRARIAMERADFDRDAVREGLVRGGNHPDDIPAMIWLYRNFSDAPYFRDAAEIWRASDADILQLVVLADLLAIAVFDSEPLIGQRRAELMRQLEAANARAFERTEIFLTALADSTRQIRQTLMFVGSVTMTVLGILAALLGWRLMKVVNASRRRFQAIFEHAAVGMAELSPDRRFINVNAALCEILGFREEDLLRRRYDELVRPADREMGPDPFHDILTNRSDSVTLEQRFIRQDKGVVWGKLTLSGIDAGHGRPEALIAVLEDVSESRRLSFELAYQADHDSLTGLLNRRALERNLAHALRAAREMGAPQALCFIDLDQFKVVNDTSGHAAGDQMLRQVSELLRAQLREGDILARIGGDEFGMLLKDCDLEAAGQVANKLCRLLADFRFEWEGRHFDVSCSMGVVPITADLPDIDTALRSADIACYLAKEQGRNRVHLTRPDDSQVAHRRGEMEWLSRIRMALDEDRFYLDAQRIVPLADKEAPRYEVLVRLIDEQGEPVYPGAFLPPAERFGAIHDIDRWVLTTVCRMLADHAGHLDELGACHVNISGRSFDRPEFQGFVLETLRYHGIPPEKLCLEVTETAAISNLPDAIAFMSALSDKGCRFALDDFGAGLSSFGYLRQLPVDYLKIDGVFVRDIADDVADLAMVRAINEVGQVLGKQIIAEFVETEQALSLLREMGVHYGQGFGIHRPERFTRLLGRG